LLDIQAMEKALNTAIGRHAVLRTEIRTVEGEPAQQILEGVHIPLRIVDLKSIPAQEREQRAFEVAT